MKAILMSIRPQHVANILNKIKTLEIRKRFPSDYVGWVYIYCTKDKNRLVWDIDGHICIDNEHYAYGDEELNGKVVARFWCDKVEEIIDRETKEKNRYSFGTETLQIDELEKMSCLNIQELCKYIGKGTGWRYGKYGKAIHITKLEVFDKPKDIKEFYGAFTQKRYERIFGNNAIELDKKYGGLRQPTRSGYEYTYPLTRAPQNYCYIEV